MENMEITFKGKNIFVTGGTGFVGSHLIEKLVKQKAKVVTTFLERDSVSYFMKKKLDKKTVMIQADVEDFEKMFDIITKHNIEYIFHLAAQAQVEVAYYNPKRTLYTNILGTINVLECARLYTQIKAIIVASSDKAYGKLNKEKYIETDELRGDHPYEVSKSSADLISHSYFKTYQVPVVITRFGNIYGEGDLNFSRIVPGIMKALVNKEILEIRSDGKYVRDFLYVKDVVDGYLVLAKNIEKTKGQAFNFGSKDNISVLSLIKTVETYLNKRIKYRIMNKIHNEIPYQSLSYGKIKKTVGWIPKYNIKSSIGAIFEWYSRILG